MGEVIRRGSGWSLRFYENGRRRVLASKQGSHADAKRMLLEIEARIARGEAGIAERRKDWPTMAALTARFLAEYARPKVKDIHQYRRHAGSALRRVLPYVGKLRGNAITPRDVAHVRDKLAQTLAPGTVKVTLNLLASMFSWAVREGLVSSNPCRGVERPTTQPSLDFLSRQESRQLLDAAAAGAVNPAGRMLHVAIALALHMGLRKGELLGLRWQDIDAETGRLTIARSYRGAPKSGKARHLRLPTVLVPLLRAWRSQCPASRSNAVLPIGRTGDGTASREAMLGLPVLMASIGLRRLAHPWHTLRHTFASHYVMAGGNILALQKILGHGDLKMTLLYAHLAQDFLDGELDRVKF
ncbi:MAG TPA: site-specific integrase [Pseudomonadota bacterium]|nr:site-specific integrase [Pseudomonadota bacterium]